MLILSNYSWIPDSTYVQMYIIVMDVAPRYDIRETALAISDDYFGLFSKKDKFKGGIYKSDPPLFLEDIIRNFIGQQQFSIFPLTRTREDEIKSLGQVVEKHDDYYTINYKGRTINVFTEGLKYRHSRGKYQGTISMN